MPKQVLCDTIILTNGEKIIAHVLEINDKEIKFKKCDSVDWPTSIISVEKVSRIGNANNSSTNIREVLSTKNYPRDTTKELAHNDYLNRHYKKNFAYLNVTQLLFNSEFNIGYEFSFKKNIALNLVGATLPSKFYDWQLFFALGYRNMNVNTDYTFRSGAGSQGKYFRYTDVKVYNGAYNFAFCCVGVCLCF